MSAHNGADIRRWAKKNKVELCFTPTYASWANPIEAHFGPLRQFIVANSNHRNHTARRGPSTPTCAGATPTPATQTSSQLNAVNAPGSAVRRASAGAAGPSRPQPDPARRNPCVAVLVPHQATFALS